MTDRERAFASLGCEYAEGIDRASVVIVPTTGREVRKTEQDTWEAQPWDDNYWREFDDLLDAMRFASRPQQCIVEIDQGDYLQLRGGYDWGRSNRDLATVFDNEKHAERCCSDLRLHVAYTIERLCRTPQPPVRPAGQPDP